MINAKAKVFLLIVLFLAGLSSAKEITIASPEEAGFSSQRLQRINKVMQQYVEDGKIAGMVTLVARKGKIVHHEAFGMIDIENKKPMSKDAMFRIASMSKPVTCVAVMILYEQGKFLLNDPVSKYIPEFAKPQVLVRTASTDAFKTEPARREITIRHLLNHTSGITYDDGPLGKIYKEAGIATGLNPAKGTIADLVKKLAKLPLISHPGEECHYGLSIDVLGYLVEIISGKDLDTFCRDEIFEPLQMNDTYFILPKEKLPRLARMYRMSKSGKLEKDAIDPNFLTEQTLFFGGAGLISTASDYARFAQMILNGGELDGVRIISRKTVELMTSNSIGDRYAPFRYNTGDKMGYGFGIRTERGEFDELESIGIYGWDGAFFTRFWIDPKEQIVAVFLSQMNNYWSADMATKYRVLVYQGIVD
jgi:CubicO group peptidase (beta-lactamase class C family)